MKTRNKYLKKYHAAVDEYTSNVLSYEEWIEKTEQNYEQKKRLRYQPVITIYLLARNAAEESLQASMESIRRQTYARWELCVVTEETKIRAMAGEFATFVEAGDLLAPFALYEVVQLLNADPELDFIYSDEDQIGEDETGRRNPFFKPDWSPDTLMSFWYTHHLSVFRMSVIQQAGGLCMDYPEQMLYNLTLRVAKITSKIAHISKVLCHCRQSAAAYRNTDESVFDSRIDFGKEYPKVSIVIPSKDHFLTLKCCLDTLYEKTDYPDYEVIVVDNGSAEDNRVKYEAFCEQHHARYIFEKMEFNFSKMCNIGAGQATGRILLFLNDDMEIITADWLKRMVGQAQQEHVGAVGAKLLYPHTKLIQHCGVIGIQSGPSHAFLGCEDDVDYYFGRNKVTYNYLAVTAACLMVDIDKFHQAKGFDEIYAITYNDVDLCYKLVEAGYYNVVRNDVVLYHHESVSRGRDALDPQKEKRLHENLKMLKERHPVLTERDPFYNDNLAQNTLDFTCDRRKYRPVLQHPREVRPHGYMCADSESAIDTLKTMPQIFIEGWALMRDIRNNNADDAFLYLESDSACYTVKTERVYRPDVAEAYSPFPNLEFVGFRCLFDRDEIREGIYTVNIVRGRKVIHTGKVLYC